MKENSVLFILSSLAPLPRSFSHERDQMLLSSLAPLPRSFSHARDQMPPEAHLCTVLVNQLCAVHDWNCKRTVIVSATNSGSYWQSNNLATAVNLISCLLFCYAKINVCDEEEKNALIHWFTSIKLSIFSSNLNDLMLERLWQLYLLSSVYCLFFFRFEWFDTGASSTVVLFVFSLFQGKDLFVSCFYG